MFHKNHNLNLDETKEPKTLSSKTILFSGTYIREFIVFSSDQPAGCRLSIKDHGVLWWETPNQLLIL